MRILNLYSGLGGNRRLWDDYDITAVDINPQIMDAYKANFPNDTIIIGDAHEYLLQYYHRFDFIWSSPPCQSHSKMVKATRHDIRKYPDMTLYQEIIFLTHFFKGRWVVENVKPYYEPLIKPTAVMGRHLVWSNFDITHKEIKSPRGFINNDSPEAISKMKEWLGINYDTNIYYDGNHSPGQVLRNCVHPELGLHILNESKRYGFFND